MFSTLPQKIAVGIYIFLLLSIPVGAYIASEQKSQNLKTAANEKKQPVTKRPASPSPSPLKPSEELKKLTEADTTLRDESTVLSENSSVTYGPTMDLKVILQGRPKDKQNSRTFVGIAEGTPINNPKYLISFTVDIPTTGEFKGLSLAGLDPGTKYTAFIKPTAQIATSSSFTMSPSVTRLNNGMSLTILTGDLNEDNTVNTTDYTIAKNANGSKMGDDNWNELVDFNLDKQINALDIGILMNNYGKIGHSGVWASTPSSVATTSGTASQLVEPSQGATSGYWIWIPR